MFRVGLSLSYDDNNNNNSVSAPKRFALTNKLKDELKKISIYLNLRVSSTNFSLRYQISELDIALYRRLVLL